MNIKKSISSIVGLVVLAISLQVASASISNVESNQIADNYSVELKKNKSSILAVFAKKYKDLKSDLILSRKN